MGISKFMEREKNSRFLFYIVVVMVALFLPLSYALATSIGTDVSVTGTLTVTGESTFTGAATFNGNVTVGNLATADTLTVTARLAADLDPNANNTIDLGSFGLAYKSIYASSTAFLNYVSSTAMDATTLNLTASSTLTLTSSTTDANTGVIYKGSDSFIHNFSHPTGNTAVPVGQNTFVGLQAGNFTMGSTASQVLHGSHNTGIGYQVLKSNTTGGTNTANGLKALYSNTTGSYNVANGGYALYSNTTGDYNIANGVEALYTNTTGGTNTANGYQALFLNTTGGNNTANGGYALYNNTTGNENTANGGHALYNNTTGNYNIAMGYKAGYYQANGTTALTTASSSIYIGSFSKGFNNSDINSIVIGDSAVGIGANTVVLGNDSILTTALKGNVGIASSTPSAQLAIGTANTTSTLDVPQLCFRTTVDVGGTDQEVYYWPCVGDACPTAGMASAGWATSTASCF
ncbi:MAG: hypothetical protein Q8P20_04110 [bacterium]|nr:hypothetical protein [bacterium]